MERSAVEASTMWHATMSRAANHRENVASSRRGGQVWEPTRCVVIISEQTGRSMSDNQIRAVNNCTGSHADVSGTLSWNPVQGGAAWWQRAVLSRPRPHTARQRHRHLVQTGQGTHVRCSILKRFSATWKLGSRVIHLFRSPPETCLLRYRKGCGYFTVFCMYKVAHERQTVLNYVTPHSKYLQKVLLIPMHTDTTRIRRTNQYSPC